MTDDSRKERPILFSGPLVRALLAGTKTQTRRLMKPQPEEGAHMAPEMGAALHEDHWGNPIAAHACPYGKVGDRLWVRERWGLCSYNDPTFWRRGSIAGVSGADLLDAWQLEYCADWDANQEVCLWRSSTHMPRWASRITLEVTEVRVQRLQEISEEDAHAEGVRACERCDGTGYDPVRVGHDPDWCSHCGGGAQGVTCRDEFERLWNTINGDRASWESNPFVWCVSFKVLETKR